MAQHFITDFITLLVTISPVAIVPLFLAVTANLSAAERRRVALRACLIATAILMFFLVLGQSILEAIGISLPAFRLAGGLILLIIALRMVYGDAVAPANPDSTQGDITVFPLATPILAGSGTITAVVVLTDNHQFTLQQKLSTAATMLLVMLITYLVLLAATPIQRVLGNTGTNVIGRVMGLILAALAMQTLVSAAKSILAPGIIP